jgi:hypothetical protein
MGSWEGSLVPVMSQVVGHGGVKTAVIAARGGVPPWTTAVAMVSVAPVGRLGYCEHHAQSSTWSTGWMSDSE